MIEKITNLAERAATAVSLSRRGFLGRLGQGALAIAGVLGGVLLFPNDAQAGNGCCLYCCDAGYPTVFHKNKGTCPNLEPNCCLKQVDVPCNMDTGFICSCP